MKIFLFVALLFSFGVAQGQDRAIPAAYRAVLRAQYAARTPSPPLDAAEAQHIYDAYLAALGKSANKPSTDSGQEAGMTPR